MPPALAAAPRGALRSPASAPRSRLTANFASPRLRRPHAPPPRAAGAAEPGSSGALDLSAAALPTGGEERVLDFAELLAQAREANADGSFIFTDDDADEPVWQHEARFRGGPMTAAELAAEAPALLSPDPLAGVAAVASAYEAEQGFREVSAAELDVALTAGGLVDLVLDVRSAAEFDAGPAIPGAVNIPLDTLSDAVRAGRLDAYIDGHVAVVCAGGQRSAQATVRLSRVFGFRAVSNVAGGMAAWAAQQAQRAAGGGGGGGGCGGGGGGCGCH
ncbi:TSTD1 [Scenedesmus sp. PABB004]|nr:TSTD1 [Scenedesmus sp. PABB004]